MRVVVTGSSGFLGSWICRLLAQSHDVVALVRPTSDLFRLSGINQLTVMPINSEDWPSYISQSKTDALVLADWWGVGSLERNDPKQFENVERIISLASAAEQSGIKIVIGVGSQAELGPISNVIREDLPDNPTSKYGIAKAEARIKLTDIFQKSDTRFVWMRVFSTYGPLDTGN